MEGADDDHLEEWLEEWLIDREQLFKDFVRCVCGCGVSRVHRFCIGCGRLNSAFDEQLLQKRRGKPLEVILAECPNEHIAIKMDRLLDQEEGEQYLDNYCDMCGMRIEW